MAKKNIDMTMGNPVKAILLFSLPLLFGNFFQQLYSFIDSIIVGNFDGDGALAAVASSGSLISLLIGLIQGISVGAGIVIAQHFGAREEEKMRKCIHTGVIFSFVLGVIISIIGVCFTKEMLILMKTDIEVLPLSVNYFKTYFIGAVFSSLYNMGSSIFRAVGDSKTPLYYLIIACIVNTILDVIFVGLLDMSVTGAAIATVISQAISMLLTYNKLYKSNESFHFSFSELGVDCTELKSIIKYGIPTGLQNSIISMSNVFIQTNINSFGKIVQAGCGAFQKIEGFATMPSGSFSMALSTYVGQNIGAKKEKRAWKGAFQGLFVDCIITEVIGIILFILAPFLVTAFSKTEDVVYYGVLQLRTESLFFCLLAFSHGMAGILRGAGYSKTPMFVMILFWVVVRIVGIPIALSLDGLNNVQTIFWFYPITWSLSLIAFLIMIVIIRKIKKRDMNNGKIICA